MSQTFREYLNNSNEIAYDLKEHINATNENENDLDVDGKAVIREACPIQKD